MKPTFNPGWLVSLMCRWSIRQLAGETGSLGYPKKACGFSEKTTGGYNHTEPMGFSIEDFKGLDAALNELRDTHQAQHIAMMMYYKPWVVVAMQLDGWPFGNSTYYKRLHSAHDFVAIKMRKVVDKAEKVEYIAAL